MEKAYRNLGYYFLLLIPLIFIGFYKTYFIQFPSFKENITSWMHIHAMIATLWIIMLIVQPLLIRNKKFKQHRLVGKISYVVFPLLILSFIPQILRVINSGYPEFVFFPLAYLLCRLLAILAEDIAGEGCHILTHPAEQMVEIDDGVFEQVHGNEGVLDPQTQVLGAGHAQQAGVRGARHQTYRAGLLIKKRHFADQLSLADSADLHLLALGVIDEGHLATDYEIERLSHFADIGYDAVLAKRDQLREGEQGFDFAHGQRFA